MYINLDLILHYIENVNHDFILNRKCKSRFVRLVFPCSKLQGPLITPLRHRNYSRKI